MILLIRIMSKLKNYQELSKDLSAIEPPYWMASRAAHLSKSSEVKMIDAEIEEIDMDLIRSADSVELFSSGNHPSAYIQETDGLISLQSSKMFWMPVGKIKVWKTIPELSPNTSPWWESLDMTKYRAHNWQCWSNYKYQRKPYGIVSTSFGCPFKCKFCDVRNFYGKYVERSLNLVIKEIKVLVEKYSVRNIKFLDEIFLFDPGRVERLCDMIIERGYVLNSWIYGRLDTIDLNLLPKLKEAGFNWIAVGIESGNLEIREKQGKGGLTNQQIEEIVTEMKNHGIYPTGNFIFGFEEDTLDTMQETFDFAKQLNCEHANFYSMMDYSNPTPPYSKYAQYSYDCEPVSTKHLTSADILRFRDNAFHDYYTSDEYLTMMSKTFGWSVVKEINKMTDVKLRRKLLE